MAKDMGKFKGICLEDSPEDLEFIDNISPREVVLCIHSLVPSLCDNQEFPFKRCINCGVAKRY